MMSALTSLLPPGAEDSTESENKGSGDEEGHGGHGTKDEVHDQQREEEEAVQDAEEGKVHVKLKYVQGDVQHREAFIVKQLNSSN